MRPAGMQGLNGLPCDTRPRGECRIGIAGEAEQDFLAPVGQGLLPDLLNDAWPDARDCKFFSALVCGRGCVTIFTSVIAPMIEICGKTRILTGLAFGLVDYRHIFLSYFFRFSPGIIFKSLNDHITIMRINLHTVADPIRFLAGDESGTGAYVRVHYNISNVREIR